MKTSMSAAELKKQAFPIRVRFAGGWKRVDSVQEYVFRGRRIIALRDFNGSEIAKLYTYTEVRVDIKDGRAA